MQEFYRYGFRIEIDDFGKEKSTLPMLKLPFVDTVKLDKSLIDCIGDRKGEIMLRQVVRLCYELGLYTTAEGVGSRGSGGFPARAGLHGYSGLLFLADASGRKIYREAPGAGPETDLTFSPALATIKGVSQTASAG